MPSPAAPSLLHLDSGRNRLIGIGMVSAAVLCFSILDSSAKWLVSGLPLLQIVFMRFLGHTVFTAAVMMPRSRMNLLRTRRPWLQLLRAMMQDQVGWIRDRTHKRVVTEANSRDSLAMACAADALAHRTEAER